MIAKIMHQRGFVAKQAYVVEQEDARVLGFRSLFGQDCLDRAKSMEATARLNKRVAKPVVHIPIRAAKTDRQLSDQEWLNVADRVLKRLGLSGHQAMIVRHGKGPDQHIHILANRIHPITFKAAPMKNDLRAIQSELRSIERDMQLTQIGNRNNKSPRYSNGEIQQGIRVKKIDTDLHRKVARAAWGYAKGAKPADQFRLFQEALSSFGFRLAQGRKSGFVILAPDGKALSLSKALRIPTKDRQNAFTDKNRATLPTLTDARDMNSGDYNTKTTPSKGKTLSTPTKHQKMPSFAKHIKTGINVGRFVAGFIDDIPVDGDDELELARKSIRRTRIR